MINIFRRIPTVLVLLACISHSQSKVSDQRLCADPDCSTVIGHGRTVLKYFAKDEGMLSFANNKPVKIFSKGAGSNPDLWGVMIDGRRGYINKGHVQEQRVYKKDLQFTVPTEFIKGSNSEEINSEVKKEEIVEKPPEKEVVINESTENNQENIDKTKQLEDEQFETKSPELQNVESGNLEIVSSFSPPVESQSQEVSRSSTPPMDLSAAPSQSQLSSAAQVEPAATEEFEVVDGTTIYFDSPPPTINEAPSLDNATPEAISPSVSLSRAAQPTDTSADNKDAPEIESSVLEDPDQTVETEGTAALSDNPGTSATSNEKIATTNDIELTEPASVVEEIQTASPSSSENPRPKEEQWASEIQVESKQNESAESAELDADIEEDDSARLTEDYEENALEVGDESQAQDYEDDDNEDAEDIDHEEYIDDLTEDQKAKLQETINKLKSGDIHDGDVESNTSKTEEVLEDPQIPVDDLYKTEMHEETYTESNSTQVVDEVEGQPDDHGVEGGGQQEPDLVKDTEEIVEKEDHYEEMETVETSDSVQVTPNQEEVPAVVEVEREEEVTENTNKVNLEQEAHEHQDLHDQEQEEGHLHIEKPTNDLNTHNEVQDDNHGHGHSHGDLGEIVVEKVAENIPDYYQPAEQKFDLPLSEQFSSPPAPAGNLGDHTTTPSTFLTDSDYEMHTPSFQTTTTTPTLNDEVIDNPESEAPIEEPSSGKGLFASITNMFSSSTVPGTPDSTGEGSGAEPKAEELVENVADLNIKNVPADVQAVPTNEIDETLEDKEATEAGTESITEEVPVPADLYNVDDSVQYTEELIENEHHEVEEVVNEVKQPEDTTSVETPDVEDKTDSLGTVEQQYEQVTEINKIDHGSQLEDQDLHQDVAQELPQDHHQEVYPQEVGQAHHQELGQDDHQDLGQDQHQEDGQVHHQEFGQDQHQDLGQDQHQELGQDQHQELGQDQHQELGQDQHQQLGQDQHQQLVQDQHQQLGQDQQQEVSQDLQLSGDVDGLLPEWLVLYIQDQAFIDGDRLALVGIIALTLLLLHLINSVMNKSSREQPLIRRLADLDRKLFAATNELLIMKKNQAEKISPTQGDEGNNVEAIREMELQLQQTYLELESSRESLRLEAERSQQILSDLETSKKDVVVAQDEAKQAQEMVEEMIASHGTNAGAAGDDQLMQVVQQLQTQLENQKVVLGKYEPRLKKKERENKELVSQIKQLRADVANANLEKERIKKELTDTIISVEESASKLNEVFKNEEEWKSLSDLLQSQLDEKSLVIENLETEMTSLKSRISVFKCESESKEEQLEILQETLDELQNRKAGAKENGESDGWDVEEENGWEVDDVNEIKELAKLRVECRRNREMKETLERELGEVQTQLQSTASDMEKYRGESESLREARDEVMKDHSDLQRRLEVLTEFFNKKEAELQRQLGLQSAKYGDVSTDAESTARQLVSVTSELESTKDQVKIIRSELEDQERSLKAAVAVQEKKAHENWVAARQAERKLTELQGELSLMRNKLTVFESRNQLLEQEKSDLTETVNMLGSARSEIQAVTAIPSSGVRQQKIVTFAPDTTETETDPDSDSESEETPATSNGLHSAGSLESLPTSPTGPESLPPLPGLPSLPGLTSSALPPTLPAMSLMPSTMMVPPIFPGGGMMPMEMRQPPLGRMSPGPRDRRGYDSRDSRSPSPQYRSPRHHRARDYSPATRSERRPSPPPGRHRASSPARSERYYRDRRERFRYSSSRDPSPYSTRSERSDRERERAGPKTSTPGDPQNRGYNRA